ncbi:MAG TPA: PepSY domain-containing protein [Beijerinckiaceae bacterium]|jgi:tellurite resistance protein|nr:PepSY domain-containing protein [Beijerinckiaceae bacterium]
MRTVPALIASTAKDRRARCRLGSVLLLSALVALVPQSARADRKPTSEERSVIERVLRSQGYQRWGDIEIEDNGRIWEIDAALARNGRRYDLKMSAETFEVIGRTRD